MFVLIIVIHYYTYNIIWFAWLQSNFNIKNNEHCCAYSLYILPNFHHITDLAIDEPSMASCPSTDSP